MPKKRNVNSGTGFGSVDAAYRRATKKARPKHKITTNYYVANIEKINSMMRKLYGRQGR
jgi:hypothetical protein|tara:strand:+ start:619 stop:795 length:177 start_codon:yes stop_codon:yes gene_type:complete